LKAKTYVVIDDSLDFLEMISTFVKGKNSASKLVCFNDALVGLQYIGKNIGSIEAVFTDYHMESMGVSGSIVAAKCSESLIPVYIVTGDANFNSDEFNVIPKVTSLRRIAHIILGD
jgi:DNA-binding NtrC family response regulator